MLALRIWSHLLNKSLMKSFTFCAVLFVQYMFIRFTSFMQAICKKISVKIQNNSSSLTSCILIYHFDLETSVMSFSQRYVVSSVHLNNKHDLMIYLDISGLVTYSTKLKLKSNDYEDFLVVVCTHFPVPSRNQVYKIEENPQWSKKMNSIASSNWCFLTV